MKSLRESGAEGLSELRGTFTRTQPVHFGIGGTYIVHLAAPLLLGPIRRGNVDRNKSAQAAVEN